MKIKRLSFFALLVSLTFLGACTADDPFADEISGVDLSGAKRDAQAVVNGLNGNGAPSGAHYNLNIIGVPKTKSADMTGNNGRRIFVKLEGNTRILLAEGDFSVLDANGTDGVAEFQLPNPDAENDGVTSYSVFARALGKPGGSASMSTCAIVEVEGEDGTVTDEEYCSTTTTIEIERTKGKSTFENVSKSLLYVYLDLDGDGSLERYPLFDEALEGVLWSYDNSGLKLYQLRFYEIPTDVN